MNRPYFAMVGNGPVTNRGCQAIALGTRRILEREFGESRFLLASFARDAEHELPENVKPLSFSHERPRWSRAWWYYQMSKVLGQPEDKAGFLKPLTRALSSPGARLPAAALVIGGDGYSTDYGHFIVDRLVIMGNYLKSLGIPVVVWGASVGPFSREPEFEQTVVRHFAGLDMVVVRERKSFDYLRSLGLGHNLRLAPDPGFALARVPCELPVDVRRKLERPCVGLNLSPLLARFATGGDLPGWRTLAAELVVNLLAASDLDMILVPHVCSNANNAGQDDELLLQSVLQRLPPDCRSRVALVPRGLSCENLKWVIGRTHVFIGARAHATIAAISSGVPCLLLAYSRKAWGIAELAYGSGRWVVPAQGLSASGLVHRFQTLLLEHSLVRAELATRTPVLVEESYAAAKVLREVNELRTANSGLRAADWFPRSSSAGTARDAQVEGSAAVAT
jgi:polysaccharide pyruvyl transferase WcaK-like protein